MEIRRNAEQGASDVSVLFMRKVLKRLLIWFSGNAAVQRLLDRGVIFMQFLMGIGSGTCPETSGERVIIEKLKELAPVDRDICIFDVGSNRGGFLDLVEDGFRGRRICVHAFEPSRYTYGLLCASAKAYSNVTLNNMALGNNSGEVELYYDQPGSGLASLTKRRVEHFDMDFGQSEKIAVDTLDNYCQKHGIGFVDLLKLDVEGHEYDVLQGGVEMFKNRRIGMVTFEFGGTCIDSRIFLQDFYYFFRKYEMSRIFRITPSGFLVPIYPYREIHEQFNVSNFLVLRDADAGMDCRQ